MKISNVLKVALKSVLSIKMGEFTANEGILTFDAEVLEVGTEVFVKNEADEFVAAPDGEYTAAEKDEEGRTQIIVVKDGKVEEIKFEGEVAETEEVTEDEQPEIEVKTEEVDPADAPDEVTEEEVVEDDRIANIETRMEELVKSYNETLNVIAGLEGRIAELEGKLAKVEAPAAEPVDETPMAEQEIKASRLSYLRKK